jgi:hypothetical protein
MIARLLKFLSCLFVASCGREAVGQESSPPPLLQVSVMDPALEKLIANRDEVGIYETFWDGDCKNFIGVDWSEEDDEVVRSCADSLNLSDLTSKFEGDDLIITYGKREQRVKLGNGGEGPHFTICGINEIIAPGYELRYVVCSNHSDTIGLIALSAADWRSLEERFPETVAENFVDLRSLPNLVTEMTKAHLPKKAQALLDRIAKREDEQK